MMKHQNHPLPDADTPILAGTDLPIALTIAGSDSGGGAGIQADLKTFQMNRVFGTSVITAITAQNTMGVTDIHSVPTRTISAQMKAIADDFSVNAFKVGMLGTAEIIECVAAQLKDRPFGQFVLDPVMIAKGGAPLLMPDAVDALKNLMVPLADVITPNIPEAEHLSGLSIQTEADAQKAAEILQSMGAKTVVIKGGHQTGAQSTDFILLPDGRVMTLQSPRFDTPHTHGTGCTFSACITAQLAKGQSVEEALKVAKAFITAAITHPLGIGHGHGPTNHWAYHEGSL